jgi:hypothetical protein
MSEPDDIHSKGSFRDRLFKLEMGQEETHRLLREQNARAEERNNRIDQERADFRALLLGDGRDIGHAGRLDRVEQREASRSRTMRMAIAAAFLAIFTEVASVIHRVFSK